MKIIKSKRSRLSKKLGCRAKIVLGDSLSGSWASCQIRLKGTCCKDCSSLKKCKNPCSMLCPFYSHPKEAYDLENFDCIYYLTEWEGVIKRLSTNEERGIQE